MTIKWIGAILIISGCGGCGFLMASAYRTETRMLEALCRALEYMSCELSYHMTPLPQLCRNTAQSLSGRIRNVFLALAEELEAQVAPDAVSCMRAVQAAMTLPDSVQDTLTQLGSSLGCFDLTGQIRGIESCLKRAQGKLRYLNDHRQNRIRSYQTLGLCAGAALAILFI